MWRWVQSQSIGKRGGRLGMMSTKGKIGERQEGVENVEEQTEELRLLLMSCREATPSSILTSPTFCQWSLEPEPIMEEGPDTARATSGGSLVPCVVKTVKKIDW